MLSIQSPEAEALVNELAERTGESVEEALIHALRERLERAPLPRPKRVPGRLLEIGRALAALPDYDTRTADEILGYDEMGLPT